MITVLKQRTGKMQAMFDIIAKVVPNFKKLKDEQKQMKTFLKELKKMEKENQDFMNQA